MKKIFTFVAAALVGFCSYANPGDTVPCPAVLSFQLSQFNDDDEVVAAEQVPASNVLIELQLVNASDNLNGFNMEVERETIDGDVCTDIVWIQDPLEEDWVGWSGYGYNILGRASGTHNAAWYENNLYKKCNLKCNVKPTNGRLVIIEILNSLDPFFFPKHEEPAGIGRFSVDMTACADGDYRLIAYDTPSTCSFSFTGGPEGSRAWTADEPVVIELTKAGDIVKIKSDEPVVEPITISGVVLDSKTEEPVEGVTVTLQDADAKEVIATTTTGAEGDYMIVYTPQEGKAYNVTYTKDGYEIANYSANEIPDIILLEAIDTGISTVGVDGTNGRIYDIQGRELKSVPEHGIYIQNGKKYVK